ncbi:hypothetical protein ACJ73_09173, partial [Blastomyces percursus]
KTGFFIPFENDLGLLYNLSKTAALCRPTKSSPYDVPSFQSKRHGTRYKISADLERGGNRHTESEPRFAYQCRGNDWDSLRGLFYVDDSDPSDTLMSIATNKGSRDYEDDEGSNTSFGPQCSSSCSDRDSVVLEINSSNDMPVLDYKRGDVVSKTRVPSAGDNKHTYIAIDDGVQDLSDDDRIPISLTAPNMCSWEPSVGSDDESDSEGQTPPSAVLIEDGGVTTEEWLVDEILESMLEDDDQGMRWYFMKWKGYDPSWQPVHDLNPGCEELVHEFHAKLGKVVESYKSLKRRGRPPLRNRSRKARFTF